MQSSKVRAELIKVKQHYTSSGNSYCFKHSHSDLFFTK